MSEREKTRPVPRRWLRPSKPVDFPGTQQGNQDAALQAQGSGVLDHQEFLKRGVSWGSFLAIGVALVIVATACVGYVWSEARENRHEIAQLKEDYAIASRDIEHSKEQIQRVRATAALHETRLRAAQRQLDQCNCEAPPTPAHRDD